MGLKLSPIGQDIVRKGGHDDASNDDMLFIELVARAPGLTKEEYGELFVAIMLEYGEDALFAIRNGYVQFEERPAGERTAPGVGSQ